jgi:hypothetical protein
MQCVNVYLFIRLMSRCGSKGRLSDRIWGFQKLRLYTFASLTFCHLKNDQFREMALPQLG